MNMKLDANVGFCTVQFFGSAFAEAFFLNSEFHKLDNSIRLQKMTASARFSCPVCSSSVGITPLGTQNTRLCGKRICYTTPAGYAERLKKILLAENAKPIWCPSVVIESNEETKQNIRKTLVKDSKGKNLLGTCSAIAFTSRAGISAFADALHEIDPLNLNCEPLALCALGKDLELVQNLKVFEKLGLFTLLSPKVATPRALVEELGEGNGRRVLCPVPHVLDLDEPFVVPEFLNYLEFKGWKAVRVNAYVTRWAGLEFAKVLDGLEDIDVLIFTSTAEVQGFLKGLDALEIDWEMFRRRNPKLFLAAHGPVTASGASKLGVRVDVVGQEFQSFSGVVDSIARRLSQQC